MTNTPNHVKLILIKLSSWAKSQGISYNQGKLPVSAEQMATGTILVKFEEKTENKECVVYARVSSSDHKFDLNRQIAKVVASVTLQGFTVSKTVSEIGSGLNGYRPKLMRLLGDSSVK